LSRRGIIACAALLALSFAITPSWFGNGRTSLANTAISFRCRVPRHVDPACSFKLRDNDARLLLLAAAFPQRWFYDAFILWLIPKSRREIVASVGASCWWDCGDGPSAAQFCASRTVVGRRFLSADARYHAVAERSGAAVSALRSKS